MAQVAGRGGGESPTLPTQEDRFAANDACVHIAILLRFSDFITILRKHEKMVWMSAF